MSHPPKATLNRQLYEDSEGQGDKKCFYLLGTCYYMHFYVYARKLFCLKYLLAITARFLFEVSGVFVRALPRPTNEKATLWCRDSLYPPLL